jgi:hypothetical protein
MSIVKRQRAVGGFTKAEIARVLRGAEAAGFPVKAFEIRPDGVMRVSRGTPEEPTPDPFDTWKAKRDAR